MVKKKKSSKKSKKNVNKKPLNTMVPKNNLLEEKPMQVMTSNDFKKLASSGIEDLDIKELFTDEKEVEQIEIPKKKPKDEYEDIFQDIFSSEDAINQKYESLKEYDKSIKKEENVSEADNSLPKPKNDETNISDTIDNNIVESEDIEEESIDLNIDLDDDESVVEEIDLNIDFDDTATDLPVLSEEKISLATGFVDEKETKEIEDFLFEETSNLTKDDKEISNVQTNPLEDELLSNLKEPIENPQNILEVPTIPSEIDSITNIESETEDDDESASDSTNLLSNNELLKSIVDELENSNLNDQIVVSPDELEKFEEIHDNNKIAITEDNDESKLDLTDVLFDDDNNKKELELEKSLEMQKNIENLKEEIGEEVLDEESSQLKNPVENSISIEDNAESKIESSVDNHLEENSKFVRDISKTEKIIAVCVVVAIIVLSIYLFITTFDGEKVGNNDTTSSTKVGFLIRKF